MGRCAHARARTQASNRRVQTAGGAGGCLGKRGPGWPGLRGPAETPGPASPPRPRDPEGRPLGETPNTGLDVHLLPLSPKPGANWTDGTTWQTSKALKTKKETNMCAFLACHRILFLRNRVSHGQSRNSLSIIVYNKDLG